MTIDHVGAYLYPDMLWLRVIGRMSFPIWFFLIGYARHYRVGYDLILWAAVLAALNPFLGEAALPFNALVTIIACRWLLQSIDRHPLVARQATMLCFACMLFLPLTYPLMEYGTLGLLYALMGYAAQHGDHSWRNGKLIALTAFILFVGAMQIVFHFSLVQALTMMLTTGLITLYLWQFKHKPITLRTGKSLQRAMVWWSRHSMQYYVIHRVLLQAFGVAFGTVNMGLHLF